jgi:hypothetical protein
MIIHNDDLHAGGSKALFTNGIDAGAQVLFFIPCRDHHRYRDIGRGTFVQFWYSPEFTVIGLQEYRVDQKEYSKQDIYDDKEGQLRWLKASAM